MGNVNAIVSTLWSISNRTSRSSPSRATKNSSTVTTLKAILRRNESGGRAAAESPECCGGWSLAGGATPLVGERFRWGLDRDKILSSEAKKNGIQIRRCIV